MARDSRSMNWTLGILLVLAEVDWSRVNPYPFTHYSNCLNGIIGANEPPEAMCVGETEARRLRMLRELALPYQLGRH